MESELKNKEIQTVISKVKGLRNKYYAHLDRNPKQTIANYTPCFEEVEKLLNLSGKIISIIGGKVLDSDYIFKNQGSGKAGNILKSIAESKTNTIEQYNQRFKRSQEPLR